jgi:hypothetical protein
MALDPSNRTVPYYWLPRLLEGLSRARSDPAMPHGDKPGARVAADPGRLGDQPAYRGPAPDLSEIIDDQHERTSCIVTGQLPVEDWQKHIGNATNADAVVDRLVHGVHLLELNAKSMRKGKICFKGSERRIFGCDGS